MFSIEKYSTDIFDSIKHVNDWGEEYWLVHELQTSLEYSEWWNFINVIDKARIACLNSSNPPDKHFVDINKSSPCAVSIDCAHLQGGYYD